MITFDEFKRLPKMNKVLFILNTPTGYFKSINCPFWLERIHTSLTKNKLAINCSNELIDIYNEIIDEYKQQVLKIKYDDKYKIDLLLKDVKTEYFRAKKIHPDYPDDIFEQLAIMQEEAGEVTKAVLDYKYKKDTIEHIKEELTQTAAMCIRMINNLK